MSKLKSIIEEDNNITGRIKESAKRIRLASVGLFKRVGDERVRIFNEFVEAGDGDVDKSSITQKVRSASRGVVVKLREESKKIFDDLVEAGEAAGQPLKSSKAPVKKTTAAAAKRAPAARAKRTVATRTS